MEEAKQLAAWLRESRCTAFFGGAGVSTESGMKDYRSEDGIYHTVKEYGVSPEVILSHDFFVEQPGVFYDFYRRFFLTEAKPNPAHLALAELERRGLLQGVITQNIDGLHQAAGSRQVLELHGNAGRFSCPSCGLAGDAWVREEIARGEIPRCPSCGGVMKPEVTLYGERLDEQVLSDAVELARQADLLIVGGTSLAVSPANSLVLYFGGDHLVMINREVTQFDSRADLILRGKIGQVMTAVMEELGEFCR